MYYAAMVSRTRRGRIHATTEDCTTTPDGRVTTLCGRRATGIIVREPLRPVGFGVTCDVGGACVRCDEQVTRADLATLTPQKDGQND